jgi:hypothetical protein
MSTNTYRPSNDVYGPDPQSITRHEYTRYLFSSSASPATLRRSTAPTSHPSRFIDDPPPYTRLLDPFPLSVLRARLDSLDRACNLRLYVRAYVHLRSRREG